MKGKESLIILLIHLTKKESSARTKKFPFPKSLIINKLIISRMLTSISSRFVRRVATNARAASTISRIHAREVIDR